MAAVMEQKKGLRRAMPANYEVKDPDTGPPLLFGHVVIWNEWAEINSLFEGHFLERMIAGSWDKTIRENLSRMRCLFQHGEDPDMGRKVIGPIQLLEPDDIGLRYEVPLFPSVPDLIVEGLRAGVYGTSALFDVIKWDRKVRPQRSAHNPEGLEERTIQEVRGVEFGPCVFQWYEGATATARSETDEYMLKHLAEDPERFREVAKRAGIVIDEPAKEQVQGVVESTIGEGFVVTTNTASVMSPTFTMFDVPAVKTTETPVLTQYEDYSTKRRYQRAAEAVGDTIWATTPRMLQVILSILDERMRGYKPTAEELADRTSDGRPTPDGNEAGPVAVIPVGGTIMPHAASFGNVSQQGTSIEGLQQQLRAAMKNPDVEMIVFNIDSPGGAVDLVPEFAAEIIAAREEKPIYALANTMAASAAYWIAAASSEISVTPSGEVGSIGVYSAHNDISGEQAQKGVKTTLVSAGENKTLGNPFEPLSDAAKAEMQKKVDAYYEMFVNGVALGRGVDAKTVKSDFGQGSMFLASDAVDVGLADHVETYDQMMTRLQAKRRKPMDDTYTESEPVPPSASATPTEPEPPVATTRPAAPKAQPIYGQSRVEDRWTLKR